MVLGGGGGGEVNGTAGCSPHRFTMTDAIPKCLAIDFPYSGSNLLLLTLACFSGDEVLRFTSTP